MHPRPNKCCPPSSPPAPAQPALLLPEARWGHRPPSWLTGSASVRSQKDRGPHLGEACRRPFRPLGPSVAVPSREGLCPATEPKPGWGSGCSPGNCRNFLKPPVRRPHPPPLHIPVIPGSPTCCRISSCSSFFLIITVMALVENLAIQASRDKRIEVTHIPPTEDNTPASILGFFSPTHTILYVSFSLWPLMSCFSHLTLYYKHFAISLCVSVNVEPGLKTQGSAAHARRLCD